MSRVTIIGAGPAGSLLSIYLARRGFEVEVFESRGDMRNEGVAAGRSINLALAARGIRALERAGMMERVRPLLIPMRGRMIHDRSGTASFQPYGQRADESILNPEYLIEPRYRYFRAAP